MAELALADQYEAFYRDFDSPLMCQLRREAYGEDIGQYSWVGARNSGATRSGSASARRGGCSISAAAHAAR